MKSSTKRHSKIQLFFLITLLIVVSGATWWISKNDLSAKVNSFFSTRSIPVFYDSTIIVSTKKDISGFWKRKEERVSSQQPYSITDCIEIKSNGIFWQVIQFTLWLPDGDTVPITHVLTGYIQPFKKDPSDTNTALVDAFAYAQSYATLHDTCYVPKETMDATRQQSPLMKLSQMSKEVYAYKIRRNNNNLTIDQKQYTRYDTTANGLASFFPSGAIDIIDKFSINRCVRDFSIASFVKTALSTYYRSAESLHDTGEIYSSVICRYYQPLVAAHLASSYTSGILGAMKGHIATTIFIRPDGSVEKVKLGKNTISNRYFPQRFTEEILSWHFAHNSTLTTTKAINYDFIFK